MVARIYPTSLSYQERQHRYEQSILNAFARHARPILLARMAPNNCIAATRVTIEVLRFFDIICEPLAVTAMLFNKAFLDLGRALGRAPTAAEWEAHDGVWSVGIGAPRQPGDPDVERGWYGHLVALTAPLALGSRMIVDASLDQGSRPQYGIVAPPVALVPVGPAFLEAGEYMIGEGEGGIEIGYKRLEEYEPYEIAPDWQHPEAFGLEIVKIIRAIESEVIPNERSRAARA